MSQELVSIIVPIYKVERYIQNCVDSILRQQYQDLEIILVDDGSPDHCPHICDEYAKKDKRVRVIHKKNGGLSDARNVGIDVASGDYIMFVDSDDYVHENMVSELLSALKRNQADLAICNYETVNESGGVIKKDSPMKNEVCMPYEMLKKLSEPGWCYYVIAWNRLYKREIFENLRFPIGKINEDQFTAHLIYDRCKKIVTISEKLYFYVQRDGSIMSKSCTVKSLDDIEALYSRSLYYQEHAYDGLQKQLVKLTFLQYYRRRIHLKPKSSTEKKRVSDIDKTVKQLCHAYHPDLSWKQKIVLLNPSLVFGIVRLVERCI